MVVSLLVRIYIDRSFRSIIFKLKCFSVSERIWIRVSSDRYWFEHVWQPYKEKLSCINEEALLRLCAHIKNWSFKTLAYLFLFLLNAAENVWTCESHLIKCFWFGCLFNKVSYVILGICYCEDSINYYTHSQVMFDVSGYVVLKIIRYINVK